MRVSLFSLFPGHRVETGQDPYELGLRRAVLAEELGFHGFWVAEHHVRSVSCMPNPAVFLAAVAQRTQRIRLGTAVAVLSVRHPLLVAEEYALVDRLSGGRLDFGVGSGTSPAELEGIGIDVESKRERFAETLALVRRAWTGEGGSVSGRFHQIGDLRCNVEPMQRPAPPVWVAASSTEAAREVGIAGDRLLLLLSPEVPGLDKVREYTEAYRSGLSAAGNGPTHAQVAAAAFACVTENSQVARDRASTGFARLIAAQGGTARGQVVVDSMIERGTALVGSPDLVTQRLLELASVGVGEVLAFLDFGGAPGPEIEESMRAIADVAISGLDSGTY